MANTKISALDADTAPTADDLLIAVNDPAGTPTNKKITVGAVQAYTLTFASTDLTAGVLTVTHNRGRKYVGVFVYDDGDNLLPIIGTINMVDSDTCTVDMSVAGSFTGFTVVVT